MRLKKEPSLALSSQSWCTFLSIDDTALQKWDTKSAHRRQDALDFILPNTDMYPGVERQSILMGLIIWQGREYPLGALPPENVL